MTWNLIRRDLGITQFHVPKFVACSVGPGRAWVRVLGYGIVIKDVRRHGLTFSERYGYSRFLRLGPWLIEFLPPFGRSRPGPLTSWS